jgi:hypothetical protein
LDIKYFQNGNLIKTIHQMKYVTELMNNFAMVLR